MTSMTTPTMTPKPNAATVRIVLLFLQIAFRIDRDAHEPALLHRKVLAFESPALIAAAIAAIMFWLFFEPRHGARIVPAWTI
jgi:hypothetical protein